MLCFDSGRCAFQSTYPLSVSSSDLQTIVDNALVRLLRDTSLNKDILCVLLELVAFFDKEARELPQVVLDAAKTCALHSFAGDVREPLPAIALSVFDIRGEVRADSIAGGGRNKRLSPT